MIKVLTAEEAGAVERLVEAVLGGRHQARLDEVIDVLDLPGLGFWDDDRLKRHGSTLETRRQAEQ